MARYLSDEWFDEIAAALAAATPEEPNRGDPDPEADPGAEVIVVEQRVEGGPDGPVTWHAEIRPTVLVRQGPHPAPTVTFHQSYETAVAVARGELSAQEAFMTGRITLSGRAGALLAAAPALTAVGDVLAAVRAGTTY